MSGRRHKARRVRNQLVKSLPSRVLEFTSHRLYPTPFVVFVYPQGGSLRVEVLESGEIKLHTFGLSGAKADARELSPDEWPDPVCVYMAKRALIEGDRR